MHRIVPGRTGYGKSTLLREHLIPAWRRQGTAVLVCDPLRQRWDTERYGIKGLAPLWVTGDPFEFVRVLQQSRQCVFVVDEPELSINASTETERAMVYTATISRNHGHLGYFLAQSAYQIPIRFRSCCTWGYLFGQIESDARCLASLFGEPSLMDLVNVPDGTCYVVKPLQKPVKVEVFPSRMLTKTAPGR